METTLVRADLNPKQLLRNGDMDPGDGASEPAGWTFIKLGDAQGSMQLSTEAALDPRRPESLKLEVTQLGQRCGIVNAGKDGIAIEAGRWYEATFYARTAGARRIGLVFSLESDDGQTVCARATIPELGTDARGRMEPINAVASLPNDWRKYVLSMQARQSHEKCRLVITPIEPVAIWLDAMTLVRRD